MQHGKELGGRGCHIATRSQKGESDTCLCSAGLLLFRKSRTQTHGLVLPTSINLICIIPMSVLRDILEIPDPVKSTTVTIITIKPI